ncbi:MAG TPA: hypothetical protein VM694_38050, partial [Polyangium sp.]|nr:hypothetical protein [Polyangium sp.]
ANMRVMAAVTWSEEVDQAALLRAQSEAIAATREARARGVEPDSAEALVIAERFVRVAAKASGKNLDDAFADQMRRTQDPRALRYWELVSVMTGEPLAPAYEDGRWLSSAIARFLER